MLEHNGWLPRNLTPKIILDGDLNIVLKADERKGVFFGNHTLRNQIEVIIEQQDLLDIKPKKGRYTWSNKLSADSHIAARIDRFLIHSNLLLEGKIVASRMLPNLALDHKLIMLSFEEEENLGPIPFRFNPLWIKNHGFEDIVENS